jgi:hypothetical protein
VAAVIGKALRRDLAERFESCGAFGVALAAAAKEVFPDMAGSTVFNTGTGAAISSPVVFGSSETSSSAATVSAWPKVTSTATAPAVVLGSKGDAAPSNPPAQEGDDDIAIPGVGARKGTGLPVGLIMAAAAIIALVFGAKSALEKSTQSSASAVAAPAPQGLVETKPLPASTPPARLPERPNEPVAVPGKDPGVAKEPAAAKPVASSNTAGSNGAVAKPVASSAPVGGAASKAVAAKDAPGKEGDLGVQEAPANPPNRKPTSGEVFGGVNLSDDY